MASRSGATKRANTATAALARVNAAGDETRDQLMTVAARLFAEFGIDGVSIRQIAAEAGQRNPAAVNYHFGDKEALVQAILERHAQPINMRRHAMLDAIEAATDVTVRTVAEASVLPLAAELEGDGHYLGFLAQVARSRVHLLSDYNNPAFMSATLRGTEALKRVGATAHPALASARLHMSISMLPSVLADYQRAMRAGEPGLTPLPLFVSYLVDLFVAMITAPLSPSTRSLLQELP